MKQVIPKGVGDGTGIVLCPHCQARLTPRADMCGRKITCPNCREALILPEAPVPNVATPATPKASQEKASPRLIPVVCRLCGTRMYAQPKQVGQALRCPDCYVETVVTPEAVAQVQAKRTVHKPYAVVDDAPPEQPQQQSSIPGAKPQPDKKPKAPASELILVACPLCATRMHFAAKNAGRRAKCPDCETEFTVPQPPPKKKAKAAVDQPGDYTLDELPIEAPATELTPPKTNLPAPKQWSEREEEPPPPKPKSPKRRTKKALRSFFTGVFFYPWRSEVVLYWLYFTAGITLLGLLITAIMGLYASGNPMGGFAMAFPAMACLWIGLLTFTFGGACSWSILRDTAAGADEVEEWPSANWQVWIYPLVYLFFIVSVAAVFGYAIQWAAETPPGLAQAATAVVLTPLLLLSTLETGHPLSIFSAPVLGSLFRSWRSWTLYYFLHLALFTTTAAILLTLATGGPSVFAGILAGPLIASVWFISARLLGRLAYRLEDDSKQRAMKEPEITS